MMHDQYVLSYGTQSRVGHTYHIKEFIVAHTRTANAHNGSDGMKINTYGCIQGTNISAHADDCFPSVMPPDSLTSQSPPDRGALGTNPHLTIKLLDRGAY